MTNKNETFSGSEYLNQIYLRSLSIYSFSKQNFEISDFGKLFAYVTSFSQFDEEKETIESKSVDKVIAR